MLSRNSSDAARRPQKPKSTSSLRYQATVPFQSSPVDRGEVDQDAITAANLAFERANRNHTLTANRDDGKGTDEATNKGTHLKRTQSIRFVGPNSRPISNRGITCREAPGHSNPGQSHENSTQPGHILHAHDSALGTGYPEELFDDHVASEPSSYRKLRKTTSLFNPGKIRSAGLTEVNTRSKGHFKRHSLHSPIIRHKSVENASPDLHRSFSFATGITDKISTNNLQGDSQDAAIQLARDTFLQEVQQQRLKERPSFLNLSRRHKTSKAFRRTVRTSSTNSYGTAISSPMSSNEPKRTTMPVIKARTFSYAWKEKMKRLFKRPTNDEVSLPVQQLDAKHAHYGGRDSPENDHKHYNAPFSESEAGVLHQTGSRRSSLQSEAAFDSKSPRPVSIRSDSSDDCNDNDKSRVTSWTDSTAANTINGHMFVDRKRLSVIKEDGGPHQSSSSNRFVEPPEKVYSNFRQPIKHKGTGRVEAQRIYSALQREINNHSPNADPEESGSENETGFGNHFAQQPIPTPERRSSMRPKHQHSKFSSTSITSSGDEAPSRPTPGLSAANLADRDCNNAVLESGLNNYQRDYADIIENSTPQEFARRNEPSLHLPKRPLREVKSAFFPPSMHLQRSKTSPYRRAMYASGENEDAMLRSRFADQRATISNRLASESVAESESVYSRSSGGRDFEGTGSAVSLAKTENSSTLGAGTVITDYPLRDEQSSQPTSPEQWSSANLHDDSRGFMISHTLSFGDAQDSDDHASNSSVIRESGHKREVAQLDGEAVEIGQLKPTANIPKQPLTVIHGNRMKQPFPVREASLKNAIPIRSLNDKQNENRPLTSSLPRSHESGFKDYASPLSENKSRHLCKKISQVSLSSQSDRRLSPRDSPARDERLRRLRGNKTLQSSSPGIENQSPCSSAQGSKGEYESPGRVPTQAGKNHTLVNGFLRTRRSQMRISEEDGNDPAFL